MATTPENDSENSKFLKDCVGNNYELVTTDNNMLSNGSDVVRDEYLIMKESESGRLNNLRKPVNRLRIFRTMVIMVTFLAMGSRTSVIYAVMPDLRVRMNTTVEHISYAISMGSLGAIIGSPAASFADRFGRHGDLIMAILTMTVGIANCLKAITTKLWIFAVSTFFDESACIIIGSIADTLTLSMWGLNAPVSVHTVHFGFPVGLLVGSLVASPFVSGANTGSSLSTLIQQWLLGKSTHSESLNAVMEKSINGSNFTECVTNIYKLDKNPHQDSEIGIAIGIVALILFVLAVTYFILQFAPFPVIKVAFKKRSYKWREIMSPAKWANGNSGLGIRVFVLLTLFFVLFEDPGKFLPTYAVDSGLNFTNQEATFLNAGSQAAAIVSRFINIFLSKYVSNDILLAVMVHGTLISAIFLAFYGTRSHMRLWTGACAFNFFFYPMWVIGINWANEHIVVFAVVLGVADMIRSGADMCQTLLQGWLYDNVSIEAIFYTIAVYAALDCVVVYLMFYVGHRYGKRTFGIDDSATERSGENDNENRAQI